jgi:hypothetical protein
MEPAEAGSKMVVIVPPTEVGGRRVRDGPAEFCEGVGVGTPAEAGVDLPKLLPVGIEAVGSSRRFFVAGVRYIAHVQHFPDF